MTTEPTTATESTAQTRNCCDICTNVVDRAAGDTPDRRIAANFGNDEEDITTVQAIETIAEAVEASGTIEDARLKQWIETHNRSELPFGLR